MIPGHDLASRLRFAIRAARHTQASLSNASGVPVETIGRILTRETKNPSVATLMRIAPFVNVSVGALLGERSSLASAMELDALRVVLEVVQRRLAGGGADVRRIANVVPIARSARLTRDAARSFPKLVLLDAATDVPAQLANDAPYVFRVVGDALTGAGVVDGDALYARGCSTPEEALAQLAVCQLNGVWHARVLCAETSGFVLRSVNGRYADIVVDGTDELRVLGYAVGRFGCV